MSVRVFSPYEQNQLVKYGFPVDQPDHWGNQPVEYITHHVDFAGHVFMVNPHVLIPRVESEELVDQVVKYCLTHWPSAEHLVISDVGTGSGALGLSVWLALFAQGKVAQLLMSDVSAAALEVAQHNCHQHLPAQHQSDVTFLVSDLLAEYPKNWQSHVMIANLPYIPTERIATLDTSVRDYEPVLALDGGPTGLDVIHQLLTQAPTHLKPDGRVFLEIDHTHTPATLSTSPEQRITVTTDQFGQPRFATVSWQTRQENS